MCQNIFVQYASAIVVKQSVLCVVSNTVTVSVNCVALMIRGAAALCVTRGGITCPPPSSSSTLGSYLSLPSPGKPCCHGFDMVSLFGGGTPPVEAQRSLSHTHTAASPPRSPPHLCRLPVL